MKVPSHPSIYRLYGKHPQDGSPRCAPVAPAAMIAVPPWPPDDGRALVLVSAMRRRRSLATLGVAVAAVLGAGMLGLHAVALSFLTIGVLTYSVLVGRDALSSQFAREVHGVLGPRLQPAVAPECIAAGDLQTAYVGILAAHEELRQTLRADPGVAVGLRDLYDDCTALVESSGRVARSGVLLHDYLLTHSAASAEEEVKRLDAMASATADRTAAVAFRRAAAARRKQVDLHKKIEGLYERVKARLYVVTASLDAVTALGIRLRAQELEQHESAEVELVDSLDELRGDLDVIEASLEGVGLAA